MKIFLHFNQLHQAYIFHEMAKYWSKTHGWNSYAGITILKNNNHLQFLKNQKDINYEFIDVVDEIEQNAIERKCANSRIVNWEKKFNTPLTQLIMSDRNIGYMYNFGYDRINTKIMNIVDHEVLKSIICEYLDIYDDRLNQFKPDFVVLPTNASLHSRLLVKICELYNIPFYIFLHSRINQNVMLAENNESEYSNYLGYLVSDRESRRQLLKKELSSELLDFYTSYSNNTAQKPDWHYTTMNYLDNISKLSNVLVFKHLIKTWLSSILSIFRSFQSNQHLRKKSEVSIALNETTKVFKIWLNLVKFDNIDMHNELFVFFPLHVNPEASTSVLSPNFANQQNVIETLSKNIPLSHKLYVKEHPAMAGKRPLKFYRDITKFPNVRLISPYIDSHELIRQSSILCTITGTAALEAYLMNKPVILFQQTYFSKYAKIDVCSDLNLLGQIIKEKCKENYIIENSKDEIKILLSAIEFASFKMPSNFLYQKINNPNNITTEDLVTIKGICELIIEVHNWNCNNERQNSNLT